ncbi:MAG: hypothetical protein GEU77_10400 [Deltaproteobacteria bacterium]|nr:hypothetical protein [Deltaproteobacteria bacterium]
MAKKKRRKRSWLRTIFLFVLTPLIVWSGAFIIWLFWNDIAANFTPGKEQPKPAAKAPREIEKNEMPARTDDKQPKEKILEEDRKKLGEIIKKENR